MRLRDLQPRWFDVPGIGTDKDGITFLCPCPRCRAAGQPVRLGVQFANPVQGGVGVEMTARDRLRHVHDLRTFDVPPGTLWHRTGETFDDMTLTPSVDAEASGHWHGFLTNGEIR
jgi:hypothetical protein